MTETDGPQAAAIAMDRKGGVRNALGAAALFGASTPAAKLLLRDLSPLMLSALLYLGAGAALSVHRFLATSEFREAQITRHDIGPIIGIIFFGGILGPVMMLLGLRRLSALSGALLLNLEAPFTAVIAVGLMREYLGRREALAAAAIMVGGMLVSVRPGSIGGSWIGAAEIAAACLSWGIDNNLTQRLSLRDPVAVAQIKAMAAGIVLLGIAMLQGNRIIAGLPILACAAIVGALAYGVSLVLAIKALRALGAARESAYFATAPFVGALFSVAIFWDVPSIWEIAGALLMTAGVANLMREKHAHFHRHEPVIHEHLHIHDDHHQHAHDSLIAEPHSHSHQHAAFTHEHPHVSDLHHRHSHP